MHLCHPLSSPSFAPYGVATSSRLPKIQVSFAKEPYKRDNFSKETYDFKEPNNRSHPLSSLVERVPWVSRELSPKDRKITQTHDSDA